MALRGACALLGVLLLVSSSSQQQGRRKPLKKEAAPAKDSAVEQLQKQIDNIVQELNLLKEQQALQTVCLKGTKINGKCYLADGARKRYHAASEDCNNLGGVLGTPASGDENQRLSDYIRQSIGPDEQAWLGVNDMTTEGSWVDQSGLAVAYKNWDSSGRAPPQPDGGTSQNCAVLSAAAGGKWLDENCREEKPSVCQFNIV